MQIKHFSFEAGYLKKKKKQPGFSQWCQNIFARWIALTSEIYLIPE